MTLTLNPALDISSSVERVEPWRKLRCHDQRSEPGGGGVNVARAITEIGGEALAIVALGGHVGSLLEDQLRRTRVDVRRVSIAASTRQNFAVTEQASGQQYRFVEVSGEMTDTEWKKCVSATVAAASDATCVVASSSLPPGVPDDVFAQLASELRAVDVPLVVDTSGSALRSSITAPVLLVKPSLNELRTIVGRDLLGIDHYEAAARGLLDEGECEVIAVSLGADGALFVPRDDVSFVVRAPDVRPVSSIGAGDSMVAAITWSLSSGMSLHDAARRGVAAGTAAVLAPGAGLCQRCDVDRLLPLVELSTYDSLRSDTSGSTRRLDNPPD